MPRLHGPRDSSAQAPAAVWVKDASRLAIQVGARVQLVGRYRQQTLKLDLLLGLMAPYFWVVLWRGMRQHAQNCCLCASKREGKSRGELTGRMVTQPELLGSCRRCCAMRTSMPGEYSRTASATTLATVPPLCTAACTHCTPV